MDEPASSATRLSRESAARRLEIPALIEVNLSGEESKSGLPERGLEEFLALYENTRGLMTMPPETRRAPTFPAVLPPSTGAGRAPRPRRAVNRDEPGLPHRRRRRREWVRLGSVSPGLTFPNQWIWRRLEPRWSAFGMRGGGRLGRGRLPHRGGASSTPTASTERPPPDPSWASRISTTGPTRTRRGSSAAHGSAASEPRRQPDAAPIRVVLRPGAPGRAAQLQRRAADRRQVQRRDPGDLQPAGADREPRSA